MANSNYIVIGSRFKPFSFNEMLAPVMLADQEHKALEEQFGELSTKASVWEGMADKEKDPLAYKQYKMFAEDLENQAAQLAQTGLNMGSRRSLIKSRGRYASEVAPIEQSYQRRRQLADEQRQAQLKDPTLRFNFNAADASLDTFLLNPEQTYSNFSGADLTKRVGQAVQNFTKQISQVPAWKARMTGMFGVAEWERIIKHGFTPAQIQAVINSDPEASAELQGIIDSVVQSTGVQGWGDEKALQDAYSFAQEGLWHGIGADQLDKAQNPDYDFMQSQYAKGLADQAADDQFFNTKYATFSHFNISGAGKEIKGLRDKLVVDTTTGPLGNRDYFGPEGNRNPLADYEKAKEILSDPNNLKRVSSTSGYNMMGTIQRETRDIPNAQAIQKLKALGINLNNLISSEEAKKLKELGVTSNSTQAEVLEAINKGIKETSTRFTEASLNLTKQDPVQQYISESISSYIADTDSKKLSYIQELNSDWTTKDKHMKSKKYEPEDDPIVRTGVVPQYPDKLVSTTSKGRRFIYDPRVVFGDAVGDIAKDYGSQIESQLLREEYQSVYDPEGNLIKAGTDQTLKRYMRELMPHITHGRIAIQGDTSVKLPQEQP